MLMGNEVGLSWPSRYPRPKPEPRHEPEIAMARLLMDTTLGDPGYGNRSVA